MSSVFAYVLRKHKHKPWISSRLQRQRQVVHPRVSARFLQRILATTDLRAKLASSKRDSASEQCIDSEESIDDEKHRADAYERQFAFLPFCSVAIECLLQVKVLIEDHSIENHAEDVAHEADGYFQQEGDNLRD